MKVWWLCATILLAVGPITSSEPQHREAVLGAWNHPDGRISVQVEAGDATRTELISAINNWKAAIDAYAGQYGLPNLMLLNFATYVPPPVPGPCPSLPGTGGLQELTIPGYGRVCIRPPNPQNLPDIIVADLLDAGPLPGGTSVTLGYTVSGTGYLWYLRDAGIMVDNGAIVGPVLSVVPVLGAAYDKYNTGGHEFGHAFGLGHAETPAQDFMYQNYVSPGGRSCFSDLNLQATWEAYQWLSGAFRTPDTWTYRGYSSYHLQYYCP